MIDMGFILNGFYNKGVVQGQSQKIKDTAISDDNTRLNERQGWARDAINKENALQQGMAAAGAAGGYNGVIDFLMSNAPERALKFQKQKVALDRDIMENKTYKLAHSNDKAKVMLEGYQLLGKFAATLAQSPQEDRDSIYQHALPMIKQINPNAPSSLNQNASDMLTIALGQAMPENQIFAAKQNVIKAQSEVEKLNQDIEARVARGETIDNSLGLRNLLTKSQTIYDQQQASAQQIEQFNFKKQANEVAQAKDEFTLAQKKETLLTTFNNRYMKSSQGYIDFLGASSKVRGALEVLGSDPSNSSAQAALGFGLAKMNAGSGQLSDQERQASMQVAGVTAQLYKKMQSLGTGNQVILNPDEVKTMKSYFDSFSGMMQKTQQKTNAYYQNQLDNYGYIGINRNDIKYVDAAPPTDTKWLLDNPTPENKAKFMKEYGYVPNMDMDAASNTLNK